MPVTNLAQQAETVETSSEEAEKLSTREVFQLFRRGFIQLETAIEIYRDKNPIYETLSNMLKGKEGLNNLLSDLICVSAGGKPAEWHISKDKFEDSLPNLLNEIQRLLNTLTDNPLLQKALESLETAR